MPLDQVARGIGALIPHLTTRHDGYPIDPEIIQYSIDSPSHAQFIALSGTPDPEIIGAASMSLICEAFLGKVAWLGSFVVHPEHRGGSPSVASQLWATIQDWCTRQEAQHLQFMTSADREAALAFYSSKGVAFRNSMMLGSLPINLEDA